MVHSEGDKRWGSNYIHWVTLRMLIATDLSLKPLILLGLVPLPQGKNNPHAVFHIHSLIGG